MDSLDLSSFFKTKSQALDFSIRLAAIAQQTFATGFNLEAELSEQFGLQKKYAILALLRTQGISIEKASVVKEFLTQLQTQVSILPVLALTLAFEPKDATLKVLSDWFLLNIKRQVLFDISVDPLLIAGTVIHFNGKFLDYSIQQAVSAVIERELTVPHTPPPHLVQTVVVAPPSSSQAPQANIPLQMQQ